MTSRPATLGQLKESGYEVVPVKQEIRRNAIAKMAKGEALFDGIVGYDETVLPQVENAILSGHDVMFLGERGQGKSRLIRQMVNLLDEVIPAIAGSEVHDDPYDPISAHGRQLVAEMGDETPIRWVGRDERYGEKLATPDISIADLIGEVDPIKVAEGRYLADELTLHYGLIPRTNRGIFAINELPDLAERIQVGLLNILEERDVQIRGYKVRLPLDLFLVASANPEDYTNRGRIITPLKDRFGAQIRTHYPLDAAVEMEIMEQERDEFVAPGYRIEVPEFMREVVAELSQQARVSPQINQRSGVSVRLSITNLETLIANALRRAIKAGETEVVPRISDMRALAASTSGKVEIEMMEEGREGAVVDKLIKQAVLDVFRQRCRSERFAELVSKFDEGLVIDVDDMTPARDYVDQVGQVGGLGESLAALGAGESPAAVASTFEFVLEGLHLSKRLNKDEVDGRVSYRGR
jgi:magnesium chelatase subunit I